MLWYSSKSQLVQIRLNPVNLMELPTIEDNVYIGAGAKIIGNAYIGHNSRIGANAVVVKTIKPNTIVVPTNKIIESSNALDNTFVPYL